MREHDVNNLDNFIMGWYMEDTSICDRMIDYFENSPNKYQGTVASGIDEKLKKSTDVKLQDEGLVIEYGNHLQQCCDLYIKKYEACNIYSEWKALQPVQIQKYNPTDGFYGWHTERSCGDGLVGSRHLAFITYLNDVTDAGETEWYYQKLKVKPEKGLTLFWGTDWTFTHRGIPSPSQVKYILTGWFNYVGRHDKTSADVV